jgi:hypothetical protein
VVKVEERDAMSEEFREAEVVERRLVCEFEEDDAEAEGVGVCVVEGVDRCRSVGFFGPGPDSNIEMERLHVGVLWLEGRDAVVPKENNVFAAPRLF